ANRVRRPPIARPTVGSAAAIASTGCPTVSTTAWITRFTWRAFARAAARSIPTESPTAASFRSLVRRLVALRFQLRLVVLDEGADLVGHVEQLGPLLLVERDRKSSESVDGDAALVGDLERGPTRGTFLQSFVFRAQALELGFQILVAHGSEYTRR